MILKYFKIALSIIIFSGCSPERRLANLIHRHPELIKSDTVYKRDTLIISSHSKDTIFQNTATKDTVFLKENNMTVKYYNDGKTVYLKGTCDTVRIIREVPFQVNSVEAKPETFWEKAWRKIKDFLIVLLLGAILFIVIFKKTILK